MHEDKHLDLACWRINYSLHLTPHELYDYWQAHGTPTGAVLALKAAVEEIERLRERVFELQADPKSGDLIPLAEPRCGDLRRSAERCITAWTVVRGGVWDPNGLMDEHMAALRKALGPNVRAKLPAAVR